MLCRLDRARLLKPPKVCLKKLLPAYSSSVANKTGGDLSKDTTTGVKKRESLRSKLASIFGGYVEPADPKDGPIPSDRADLPNTVEQATGESKLLLLAFENGFLDPFCNLPTARNGRGSKDNPVLVESFAEERLVGCICEESQNHVKFMHLYRDEPKRCQCGHWLKLVDAPKFWQKIPREDLLTIPFFQEMEMEGKLDKLLSGELDAEKEAKENAHHHH